MYINKVNFVLQNSLEILKVKSISCIRKDAIKSLRYVIQQFYTAFKFSGPEVIDMKKRPSSLAEVKTESINLGGMLFMLSHQDA